MRQAETRAKVESIFLVSSLNDEVVRMVDLPLGSLLVNFSTLLIGLHNLMASA
jgi:hypothetical protein